MSDVISNPNSDAHIRQLAEAVRDDEGPLTDLGVKVRNYSYRDPDVELDRLIRTVETRITDVDAKLLERTGSGRFRPVHYRSLREMVAAKPIRRRILDALSGRHLREINERLTDIIKTDTAFKAAWSKGREEYRRLKETGRVEESSSSFYLGLYGDEESLHGGTRSVFPLQDTILPSTTSPQNKQQLFFDYLDHHRKAWEAATRNPLGVRITQIIPQFVLSRGLTWHTEDRAGLDAWTMFWEQNRMRGRLRVLLRELLIYGEIFLRYFRRPDGLAIRSLDPSTIWDIVTNPDDIEDVYYYHQQYTILNTSPVGWVHSATPPGTLIIRQIPADEIDHHKINATSSEKRGRSQLYAILGWLLRFKEFVNDRVVLNKMRAMFSLDVSVKGDKRDVADAEAQFATPPGTGAVIVHNDAIAIDYKNANSNAADAKTDAEMILKIIAIGAGVSEQFLGVSAASTRAGALIQTEPDVKNFEMYQEIVEDILLDAWARVKRFKGINASVRLEISFPALAQEDRSAKLRDIAFAEAMDYFSKERSATLAAKEFNVTAYDFHQEQTKIRTERASDPVMATGLQQVPKQAPENGPVAGSSGGPTSASVPSKVTQTSGQMGFSAKRLSGRSPADTQATLARHTFTRGNEIQKILTNRTEGTPLRHSALPEADRVIRETDAESLWAVVADLPASVREKVRALAVAISDTDLIGPGREKDPHITVRYGLHSVDGIDTVVRTFRPIRVTLGPIRVFAGQDRDVVFVSVVSPELFRLHEALGSLPHTDTHAQFIPHITLAYVAPGRGLRWTQLSALHDDFEITSIRATANAEDAEKIFRLTRRHVWDDAARAKALEVRRARKQLAMRSGDGNPPPTPPTESR